MTDYTPTTEEVREFFASGVNFESRTPFLSGRKQFDRWLAEHDRQTAEAAYNEGARTGWMSGSGTLANAYKHNPYRKDTNA